MHGLVPLGGCGTLIVDHVGPTASHTSGREGMCQYASDGRQPNAQQWVAKRVNARSLAEVQIPGALHVDTRNACPAGYRKSHRSTAVLQANANAKHAAPVPEQSVSLEQGSS